MVVIRSERQGADRVMRHIVLTDLDQWRTDCFVLASSGDNMSRATYISAGIPIVFFSSSPKIWGNDEAQLVAPVLLLVAAEGGYITQRTLDAWKC